MEEQKEKKFALIKTKNQRNLLVISLFPILSLHIIFIFKKWKKNETTIFFSTMEKEKF